MTSIEKKAEERYPDGTNAAEIKREAFIAGWLAGQKPEWISVETKPKKNVTVMVIDDFLSDFFKGVQLSTAHWDGIEWYDYLGDKHVHAGSITHWMPLPSPPTGEKAELGEDQYKLWGEVEDIIISHYERLGSVKECYEELISKFIIHRKG